MFAKLGVWVRNLFVLAWLLVVLTLGAWLAYANSDTMTLNLLGIQWPEGSVGFYFSITFIVGVLLGWFGTYLLAQAALFGKKRELSRMTKEVNKLRSNFVAESSESQVAVRSKP